MNIESTSEKELAAIRVRNTLELKGICTKEQILSVWSKEFLKTNGLMGYVRKTFNGSILEALLYIFPDKIKIYDLNRVPNGFWTEETAIDFIKIVLEEEYGFLSDEDIKLHWNLKFISKSKLSKCIQRVFGNSLYYTINKVYPGRFSPWDFNLPKGYLTKENVVKRAKYLLEDKYKFNEEKILEKWNSEFIDELGLKNSCIQLFNGSPYLFLNSVYPNKFKPWQLSETKWSSLEKKDVSDYIRYLFEINNIGKDKIIKSKGCPSILKSNKISYAIEIKFDGDYFDALLNTYPEYNLDEYFKEFRITNPVEPWTKDSFAYAVKYILEEKYKFIEEEILANWGSSFVCKEGLEGPFDTFFNKKPFYALDFVYPGRFKAWQLKSPPRGFWNRNTAEEAIRWAVEKNGISRKEMHKINRKFFEDNRILGAIRIKEFNNSYKKALEEIYSIKV